MKKLKTILVFTIIVACISLVVLLPRNVNADESVYEVFEFVGSSYSSFEDAEKIAMMKMIKLLKELYEICYGDLCQNEPNDEPYKLTVTPRWAIKIGPHATNGDVIHYDWHYSFKLKIGVR